MKGVGGKRWYREIQVKGYTLSRFDQEVMRMEGLKLLVPRPPCDDGIEVRVRMYYAPVAYYGIVSIDDGCSDSIP